MGVARRVVSALAGLCLIVTTGLGCGRLGFDESRVQPPADAGAGADADVAPALGDACDESLPTPCQTGLTCLLRTCSCLAQLVSDEFQTCTLDPAGGVRCTGSNANGELGNGQVGGDESTPMPVVGLPPVVEVDTGAFHACARTDAGELWCWGRVDVEPGVGTPQRVSTAAPVVRIASGGFHACVLASDKTVECIGRNIDGQLGQGATGPAEAAFIAVPNLTDVVDIASGGFHTCALHDTGTVSCWGLDTDGQTGSGALGTNQPTPTVVPGLDAVVQITAGDFHTCARRAGGDVQCWGRNAAGQLGRGAITNNEPAPAPVAGLADALDLYAGDDTACAITPGGLSCWGNNSDGQLGFSSMGGNESSPMTFPTTEAPIDVALGRRHTCVLESNGAVRCSGLNTQGELGDGTQTSTTDPVPSLLSCD